MFLTEEVIEGLFAGITGGATPGRIAALERIIPTLDDDALSKLRVEECADEKSGRRYGDRAVRRGRCAKLGGGGRHRGSRWAYQVWAVWS